MVTRRDWWIGVGLIVMALLAYAVAPRYLPRYQCDRQNHQAVS